MKFILILLLLITACVQEEIEVGSLYQYDFNNDIQVTNLEDAVWHVAREVKYKADLPGADYWQTPEQTYTLKTGDCEDMDILLMYILKNKLNIDSCFIFVKNIFTGEEHGLVFATTFYISLPDGSIEKKPLTGWEIIHIISYAEVLWMAAFHHDNVGKFY